MGMPGSRVRYSDRAPVRPPKRLGEPRSQPLQGGAGGEVVIGGVVAAGDGVERVAAARAAAGITFTAQRHGPVPARPGAVPGIDPAAASKTIVARRGGDDLVRVLGAVAAVTGPQATRG